MRNVLKKDHAAEVDPHNGQTRIGQTRIDQAHIDKAGGAAGSKNRARPAVFNREANPVEQSAELHHLVHDTRNWLTALQVYCDLLRMAIVDDCERWVMELSEAIGRGQKLVASVLESAQAAGETVEWPAGKRATDRRRMYGPNPVPDRRRRTDEGVSVSSSKLSLDAVAAIRRRLPLIERLAGTRIHLQLEMTQDDGMVFLPENDFDRILLNLVLNAIDAMPHGGRLRISLRPRAGRRRTSPTRDDGKRVDARRPHDDATAPAASEKRPEMLLLRVHDSGEGIAADLLPHIFEAGVSSKSEREDEAGIHGYGLSSVRELVERAGGKVRARSRPGHGSCFEVELPAAVTYLHPTQLRSAC